MRIIIVAMVFFVLSNSSLALVVSDPTAYTYYIEQIKKMQDTVDGLQKATNAISKLHKQIEDGEIKSVNQVNNAMRGAYNHTIGASKNLQEVGDRLASVGGPLDEVDKKKEDPFPEWKGLAYLREHFKAPGEAGETRGNALKRQAAREKSYEQALSASQKSIEATKGRLEVQKELSNRIDKTTNIKDAHDLTNRMLSELLLIQTEILHSLNHLAAAFAMSEYSGFTSANNKGKGSGGGSGKSSSNELEERMKEVGYKPGSDFSEISREYKW